MKPLITSSVPEQGQLVTVRQRRYVVTEGIPERQSVLVELAKDVWKISVVGENSP